MLAVLGHPIGHSLSPVMHNAAIADLRKDALYTAIDVHPLLLKQALVGLRALGFLGANLTIPHKEQAVPLLDNVTDVAMRIGAVNTIYRDQEQLIGDNTDGAGWAQSITRQLQCSLHGMRALIIGAGGAARAVGDALLEAGCESLTLANRDVVRALTLAEYLRSWYPNKVIQAVSFPDLSTIGMDLLVNTTPVGMYGHLEGRMPIEGSLLHEGLIVSDLVYRPLQTPLIEAAKAQGARVHGGLGMLVNQGALSFAMWFGETPSLSVMERAIGEKLAIHYPQQV